MGTLERVTFALLVFAIIFLLWSFFLKMGLL